MRHMLYGFGDVAGSADDTLEVVEQVLLDYLSSTVRFGPWVASF